MRILITTDWHLDKSTGGRPRLPEMKAHIDWLEEEVVNRGVEVVAFLGDAFDPGLMLGPMYERTLYGAARRFADRTRTAAIFIAGNHDVIETSEVTTTISGLAAIQGSIEGLIVVETPQSMNIGNVTFLLLPYVSLAATRANPLLAAAPAAAMLTAQKSGFPVVVLGHMTVPGAPLGSESKEMSRGRELDLPELGDLNPVFVANGHYHTPCVVKYGGVDVVIPGSPLSYTFGEEQADRGCVVVDV